MKIKVLHVLNRLIIGGPSIIALNIINNLPENYEVILVVGGKDEREESGQHMVGSEKLNIIQIPKMKRSLNIFHDISSYFTLRKIIKEFRPDIVHTHASKSGAIGRLAAYSCKVPVILHTFHGHVFHSYFNKIVTKFFLIIERFLAKKSTKIIAISKSQREDLVNKYKISTQEKIVIIPNGIDHEIFSNHQESKRKKWRSQLNVLDDKTLLVGIVGRMAPIKNHKMFIHVIAELISRNKCDRVKFVIVGDGETRNEIQNLSTQLNIEFNYLPDNKDILNSKLIFTSWQTQMDEVYAGLDILCLTSLNEGVPISLLEAQASQKPIVSTNVGGVHDTVLENDSAFLTKTDDIIDFADKLEILINDSKKREEMGMKGFAFVKENYGKEMLSNKTLHLYNELVLLNK